MTSRRAFGLIALFSGLFLISALIDPPIFAQEQINPSGAAIFSASCGACHGSDGRGGEQAPNIATRGEVVSLADSDLIHIVQNGISGTGMPAFGYLGGNRIRSVVRYLRTLQGIGAAKNVAGDAVAGETLFYGKAGCAKCHMVRGRGGFMGPDLTNYGQGRSASAIRAAIVTPDRNPDREGQVVTVATKKGHQLTGLVRAQDNFFVVLQTEDGAFHSLARNQIARLDYSGHSLMPQSYGKDLSSKELDDLIAYLSGTGAEKE